MQVTPLDLVCCCASHSTALQLHIRCCMQLATCTSSDHVMTGRPRGLRYDRNAINSAPRTHLDGFNETSFAKG